MHGKNVLFLLVIYTLTFSGVNVKSEVLFGFCRGDSSTWVKAHDLAPQGRFFATTDFAFDPKKPDEFRAVLTRGQVSAKFPVGGLKHPWISGLKRTLFGISFDKPFTGCNLPAKRPIKFNKIVINWGALPPIPDGWGGFIITEEGKTVDLPIDRNKKLYPYDSSIIEIEPTTIKKLYFAKKGIEDGIRDYYLEVLGMQAIFDEEKEVTNCLAIWQPGDYVCEFDRQTPGIITKILPVAPYFSFQFSTDPLRHSWLPGILTELSPFVVYKGKILRPEKKNTQALVDSNKKFDRLKYKLEFKLPDTNKKAVVNVEADFFARSKNAIVLKFSPDKDFPAEVCLGTSMKGLKELYKNCMGTRKKAEFDTKSPVLLDTPAGEVKIDVKGADRLTAVDKGSYILFKTQTRRKDKLSISLSLPIGTEGKLPENNFQWYESSATQGKEGFSPFLAKDLELLEVINCGDPNDPHKFYDIAIDPVAKKKKNHLKKLVPPKTNLTPLVNTPEKGKVPITEILGKKCRATNDYYGTYFRFQLKTEFKRNVPYLVVIEHAFDRERRGTFEIADGRSVPAISTGLDTGVGGHNQQFVKEGFIFELPYQFKPRIQDKLKPPFFFWASNVWQWHGWLKADGPAISKIEIYRIKRLPKLPDLKKLSPPEQEKRFIGFYTQMPGPTFFDKELKYTGFNSVWVNLCTASTLGAGMNWRTNRQLTGGFHPGTLNAFEKLLAKADKSGVIIRTYLAQLLHFGYTEKGLDSFGGYAEDHYATYNWEDIPLKPTASELKHISEALAKAMPRLVKYKSLQAICLADPTGRPFTLRNLKDFTEDTGFKVKAIPVSEHARRNAVNLLNSSPETLKAWMAWSSKKRFELHSWLLKEIRKYRKDLVLMCNAKWTREYLNDYWSNPPGYPLSKENFAKKGINDFGQYLKFCGFDPALYKGKDGFAFQIHAGGSALTLFANNDRFETQNKGRAGRRAPNFWREKWARELSRDFSGGVCVSLSINSEESPKPWTSHSAYCFKNARELCQSMIEALLVNARYIEMETYALPWKGRISEIRKFAVPFRLLPFANPEPFKGKLCNSSINISMTKYGDRYALINAGDNKGKVSVELPTGKKNIFDLSSGYKIKLKTYQNKNKKVCVDIVLEPWSLKTLSID